VGVPHSVFSLCGQLGYSSLLRGEAPRQMRSEFDVAPGAHSTAAGGQGEQYVAAWNEAVAAGEEPLPGDQSIK
jgi:hypothetical protein